MKKILENVFNYIDAEDNFNDAFKLYEEFINMEGSGRIPESATKAGYWLKDLFEKEGFECEMIDASPNAPTLVGWYGDKGKKPIVFSGHYDTALLDGAYGSGFRVEDDKIFGPGVLDMRGGIMIALYTIRALKSAGYNDRPIKILFSGDEEVTHANSRGAEIMLEEGRDGYIAFNMETGLVDNSLCIGRKGRIGLKVAVEGVESHAGNDFESGRNAIVEMSHKIQALSNITDIDAGTTVNVGVIKGGTISNAVAKDCEIDVDIRFSQKTELERVKKEIEEVCSKTYIEGTTTTYKIENEFAAYETTEDVKKFFNFVVEKAKEYSLPEVKGKKLGGCSDAAYVTLAKTPVICSFGIQGQWNHTVREYALVESFRNRAKLISAVVVDSEELDF